MCALAHFTRAVAEEIEARARAAGHVAVALGGDWDPEAPPLLDWRARVKDVSPPRRLERVDGDPARPDDVRAAAREFGSPVSSVLRAGPLAVMPAGMPGEALRGAICPAFDPVTFALLDGRSVAWFPELRGLSAEHCARRAVAEQRLRGRTVALDRAEGFMESVRGGEPELRLETADSHVPIS
jgi:hypothetical protein